MPKTLLFFALAVPVFANQAHAAICVEINESTDQLNESERQSALFLLKEGLLENGAVVEGDCSDNWSLTHLRLGGSITVSAVSPNRRLKLTVSSEADLPGVYSQIANAIVHNKEIGDSLARDNVTRDQASPKRVKAEFMSIVTFGGTLYPPAGAAVAPTFGFGMRVELDTWAIDVSGKVALPPDALQAAFFSASGHLNGLYFLDGQANHSFYVGGGLGYGGIAYESAGNLSGAGFDLQGIGGFEMFRASTMRMLVQGHAGLPLYVLDGADTWSPQFGLSIGIGYKPQPGSSGGVPWWALFL
jgi:hypothetical protein